MHFIRALISHIIREVPLYIPHCLGAVKRCAMSPVCRDIAHDRDVPCIHVDGCVIGILWTFQVYRWTGVFLSADVIRERETTLRLLYSVSQNTATLGILFRGSA